MERGSKAINQAPLKLCVHYFGFYVGICCQKRAFLVGNKNPNLLSNDSVRFIIR